MDPQIGDIVEVTAGRGIIRFLGTTSFSQGRWAGIELDEPNGKNDGTVQGARYFTCQPLHGVFVRVSQVKLVISHEEPPVQRNNTKPTLGHQRKESASLPRPVALRSGSGASSRSASPVKTAQAIARPSPSKLAAPPSPSPTKRSPPSGLKLRKAQLRPSSEAPQSPVESSSRPIGIASHRRKSSLSTKPQIPTPTPPTPPSYASVPLPSMSPASQPERPQSPADPLPEPPRLRPVSPQIQLPRPQDEAEIQELRARIRVLEAKRADDARHVRELETRLEQAEAFVALKPKLQAKLTEQRTDLIAAQSELAEAKQLAALNESRVVDAQETLEMVMLDKEVAEERAELAEAELEEVKESLAIAEIELEVLKEEKESALNGQLGAGVEVDAKSSLAYIQLEKQNERLKDALLRLRDMTQETDQDQRRRISEMEKDLASFDDVEAQYKAALIKLNGAEAQIEDLKVQLDDALGAEDMLVQLTERNLVLGEKIEEMRITIEDLEALKELNDELEENHMETEKALQDEINAKDIQIREQMRRADSLEDMCQDLENTISQFRELVLQLQSEIEVMRTQTQNAQTESAHAASQTAAIMSLNMKLQTTAAKNQAKMIDLEIKRAEANETKELLGIVQPYLPQVYMEADSDSTNLYLFFQRMAFKTDLIAFTAGQSLGLPDILDGPTMDEELGRTCEMRADLAMLSIFCKRFSAVLRRIDVDTFLNLGRLYPEIAPMEKRIDIHIETLKKSNFRTIECMLDVDKIKAQFEHLSESYFSGFDHDLVERELGFASRFDHDLEMVAASIVLTKSSVENILKDEDAQLDLGDMDIETELLKPLQKLLDQSKSARNLSQKLTKRIEDVAVASSALRTNLMPQLKGLCNSSYEVVNFSIMMAQQVMPHITDAKEHKSEFKLEMVMTLIKQTVASTVGKGLKSDLSHWEAATESMAQLVQDAGRLLPLTMEPENVVKTFGVAPWVTRITQIKESLAINAEAEHKVMQLNDEIQGLVRTIRSRDQAIQESGVKIELLERRMEFLRKQADTIASLEGELVKARKQERTYELAMEQLQSDLDTLEQDNAKLKAASVGHAREASAAQPVEVENVPVEGSLETSYLLEQLEAFKGTVRFLRSENNFLKGQDLLKGIQSLPPISEPINRQPTPPLDPSGQSDTDESDAEEPRTPPTFHTLAMETRMLYREVIRFSASPRVVDLSALHAKRAEAPHKGMKVWMPRKDNPAHKVLERKMHAERLSRKVHGLKDRAGLLVGSEDISLS